MLEVKASLRIYVKGFSLREVSDKLVCAEDFGYSEGDKVSKNSTNFYSETMWGKRSTLPRTDDVDAHVLELVDWLEPRISQLKELVGKSSVKPDILCYLASDNGQGSAVISSETIKKLSKFDLDILFDIYCSSL